MGLEDEMEISGSVRTREGRDRPSTEELRLKNNPKNEITGNYTGRCDGCGSKDLWDDNLTYGCNDCKAVYYIV